MLNLSFQAVGLRFLTSRTPNAAQSSAAIVSRLQDTIKVSCELLSGKLFRIYAAMEDARHNICKIPRYGLITRIIEKTSLHRNKQLQKMQMGLNSNLANCQIYSLPCIVSPHSFWDFSGDCMTHPELILILRETNKGEVNQ